MSAETWGESSGELNWRWSRESRRWSNGDAGSTNKVQMVKTCHKRISNIKQSSSRRTWPRINRRSEQSTLVSQTVGLTAGLEQQSDKSTCDRHVVVSWITPVREQKCPTSRTRIQRPRWSTWMAAHGSLDNVQTKLVVIVQKLVRESARWSRIMCDQFSRRAS